MGKPEIQFVIHPSSGVPIYRQLMDQMRALIASRRISAGELVPSVRQLAEELQINTMTVSKAYARLEADGVLERVRGVGMKVCSLPVPVPGSVEERQEELRPEAERLAAKAWQLQLSSSQTIAVVRAALRSHREDPADS